MNYPNTLTNRSWFQQIVARCVVARRSARVSLASALVMFGAISPSSGQSSRSLRSTSATRPVRAAAPTFDAQQFEGVFFADPAGQLHGAPPAASQVPPADLSDTSTGSSSAAAASPGSGAGDPYGWRSLISPTSLEDLIKGSKLRLDKLITTPTAFKGGGFVTARTEFSLQAVLFAIIETYPEQVRWQSSAVEARMRMTRVAANTKVGSDQVFAEAKARLMDLEDLLGGASLQSRGESVQEPIEWVTLIDRVPLMQLLDWAHEKNLTKLVANESQFQDSKEEVQRFAELIAVLGQVALAEEMPDAEDDDYAALSKQMITQAQQIVLATKTENAQLARSAAAELGQTCNRCHESFR